MLLITIWLTIVGQGPFFNNQSVISARLPAPGCTSLHHTLCLTDLFASGLTFHPQVHTPERKTYRSFLRAKKKKSSAKLRSEEFFQRSKGTSICLFSLHYQLSGRPSTWL